MSKPNFSHILTTARAFISDHSPEILLGAGIAGMITTTILAVKATPKAMQLIEAEKQKREEEELSKLDTVKACWKCYIPAAVTGVTSTACLIGSSSVNARRNAALATAYKLSETALTEYREQVVETIGEKKEAAVRNKVYKKRMEENPVANNNVIITGSGTTLCYDIAFNQYFQSSIENINRAVNELNKRLLSDPFGYVSLNEFYDELGIDHIRPGDEVGWKIDDGLIDLDFDTQMASDGRTPCVVIDYRVAPKRGYSS